MVRAEVANRDRPAGTAVFSILTVCTGNICRSPLSEQLLQKRLHEALPAAQIRVSSAGTGARDGEPMDPDAMGEATRLGVAEANIHRARLLRDADLTGADVVLALAQEHRTAAVRLTPRCNKRAFTLLEFVMIVDTLTTSDLTTVPTTGGPADSLRLVVGAAHRLRGLVMSERPAQNLDVPDPYRRGTTAHRVAADAIDAATGRLAQQLVSLTSRTVL